MNDQTDFINDNLNEIFRKLNTSPHGLSDAEVALRMQQFGSNIIKEEKQISAIVKFAKNLVDIFSLLLFFASFLAFFSGSPELAVAIIIVIFINAFFTYYQEWAAQKQLQALKNWVPQYSKVIRNDSITKIAVKDIVVGDIIVLEEGDRVPADARLIECYELYAIEIPLTGEFEPQPKYVTNSKKINSELSEIETNTLKEGETQERTHQSSLTYENIVYMSTSIVKGHGKAVVYATGMNSKYGKIADLTQIIQVPLSPLQKEIKYFSKYSFALSFLIGGLFFAIGHWIMNLDLTTTSIFVMGVMIASVPEGLQATISSALAINVSKMAKSNVLVKRLSIVQSLGSVTLICTDKTGTLTKGEMTVNKIWFGDKTIDVSGVGYIPHGDFHDSGSPLHHNDGKEVRELLKIASMCNTASLVPPKAGLKNSEENKKKWEIIGDPTDGALLVAALKAGINFKEELQHTPIIRLFPFDSIRKTMITVHSIDNNNYAFIKGAPGGIFKIATSIRWNGKVIKITPAIKTLLSKKYEQFGSEGLRVIAIAIKENINLPNSKVESKDETLNSISLERDEIEQNLTLIGLVGMKDPPRSDVKSSIHMAQQAGIKVIMITGDYGLTAKSIATEVGIITPDEPVEVIRGEDLHNLKDETVGNLIREKKVIFCRSSPEDKLRIVTIANKMGEIVAVTGDGANDAPALKQASIGIAMGVTGTDVAKEAADIILTDDSFASIVKGIEGGRNIWSNLRKFIYYVYVHNWAELIPYIFFILLNTPLPILAIHILVIDLCIDIIPALALSRIKPEASIMEGPPRDLKEHIFKGTVFAQSFLIGSVIGIFAFTGCFSIWQLGGWSIGQTLPMNSPIYLQGITFTYASIVLGQIANLATCQSAQITIFRKNNPLGVLYIYSLIWQIGILLLTIYVPFLQPIIGTAALSGSIWAWMLLIIPIVIGISELWKYLAHRFPKLMI